MQVVISVFVCALAGLAIWLAQLNGKKSAQAEALKKEAEEYAKAQQIMDSVHRMPIDSVRQRLQERTK